MAEVIAGIRIPDSKLAREATDLLREHGTPLLLAHSLRVYLFGAIQGRHRGWAVDHELLYVGAMFHDLGLTAKYRSPDHRFEVDGANAARDFLRANGIDETDGRSGVGRDRPAHDAGDPLAQAAGDRARQRRGRGGCRRRGLDEIPVGDRDAVLAAYPRVDFERGIVRAFADGFAYKPATAFGTMNADVLERTLPGYRRPNFCDLIAANPLGG